MASKVQVMRVDSAFLTTRDVGKLSDFYSQLLDLPLRRVQVEAGQMMWAEIGVGGMPFGFRLHGGIPRAHPTFGSVLEAAPGTGATVMFEVRDINATRDALQSAGVRIQGNVLVCAAGMELFSIFEDPFGRPLQLYQPNFPDRDTAKAVTGLPDTSVAFPDTNTQIGSNRRDIRGFGYGVTLHVEDVKRAEKFYGDILNLPRAKKTNGSDSAFEMEGTVIRLRQGHNGQGGSVGFEVSDSKRSANHPVLRHLSSGQGHDALRDPDGNHFEFWQAREGYV